MARVNILYLNVHPGVLILYNKFTQGCSYYIISPPGSETLGECKYLTPVFKGKVSMFTDVDVQVFKGKVFMFTNFDVQVFEGKVFMFTDVDDVVVVQEFSESRFMFTGKPFFTVEDADVQDILCSTVCEYSGNKHRFFCS